MSLPGFTANASLYKSNQQYRLSATSTISTTSVVPQQFVCGGEDCDGSCCASCRDNCPFPGIFCELGCRAECCPPP